MNGWLVGGLVGNASYGKAMGRHSTTFIVAVQLPGGMCVCVHANVPLQAS